MRSGVPPDAGKAQESLLEAVVVILVLVSTPFAYASFTPSLNDFVSPRSSA